MTVSLCMIVKNEEDTIARCLESVKGLFDEIIIVDTGSDDKTVEIVKRYTKKVHNFKWNDDFAEARNYSLSKATSDYCMWLDADDVILKEDYNKLKELLLSLDGKVRQVVLKYNAYFDTEGNVTLSYYRERIFLRSANFKFKGAIHETVQIEKGAMYSDIAVSHKKIHPTEAGRNLRIFRKLIDKGHKLNVREKFYYARELYYNGFLYEAINQFEDFLDEKNGFIENKISACIDLSYCYALLGNERKMLESLYRSFDFSPPRAEICCALGNYFKSKASYYQAIYWFEEALKKEPNFKSGGFINIDHYGYIPALELCVCYDKLGDYFTSSKYNEIAAKFKKDSIAVAQNREYFKQLGI